MTLDAAFCKIVDFIASYYDISLFSIKKGIVLAIMNRITAISTR